MSSTSGNGRRVIETPARLTDAALVPRTLSDEEKSRFREDGFLVARSAVSGARVDAAVRAIHASFGKGMDVEPYRVVFRDGVARDPAIVALLTATAAWAIAEALLGRDNVLFLPDVEGQILPHFPVSADAPEPREILFGGLEGWHVDGMSSGEFCPFSVLVGVALSDTPEDGMGQLTVWPGSHLPLCRLVAEHGPKILDMAAPRPSIAPSRHVELDLRAGDVVALHPMLAHSWSINYSPHIRHMVYFRLEHLDHARRRAAVPRDPWIMFDGL